MTSDHHARQTALNTQQSFIVQAPAGSGKTELLVQRFLALLARVERAPEEIIAITFTRKAAAEMRQRVLEALHIAQKPAPNEPHKRKTWELGHAALQRDQRSNWNLLENPNRLRIQTIDALCGSIAGQAPLLSGLGVSNHALEKDIEEYYLQAARHLLHTLEEKSLLSTHLARLLLHLDNRVETVETLLIRMLARRDQWLPHLIPHGKNLNAEKFRQTLELSLYNAVTEILVQCDQALPISFRDEILTLMRFSAENFPEQNPDIASIKDLIKLPEAIPENRQQWLFLAQMLLTKEGTWRRMLDKRQGFPADQKSIKQSMLSLLQALSTNETLRQSLANLLEAPPIVYTESQWQIIDALCEVLPLLVAELKILFKEKNVADFSEIAMAANNALGDYEYPTDLTFVLDAKIHHLLVDEFQDTSIAQFHLLEKLTAGWQPNDGRTLFLVGDPMQSIYRFRQAEVGLFLKAQQEGLGSVQLKPLVLQANFRSTPELVEWINSQFTTIFPAQSNISTGAIVFSPCQAAKPTDKTSGVFLETFSSENLLSSTSRIIEIIKQEQSQYPENTIAILVRSRAHLKEIIPALKKENLQFSAVEIDPLYKQSIVQDLLSLTGALLHLGDRLSWLSVLRAPWCGLTLHDLHAISQERKILWEALSTSLEITNLSEEGKKRLAVIVPIFKQALIQRGRLSLRMWIEETWHALKGPACVTDTSELSSAESYFKLLSTFDQVGETPDIATLKKTVKTQYATPSSPAACGLYPLDLKKLGRRRQDESPEHIHSYVRTANRRSLASMPSRHSVHPERHVENDPRTSKAMGIHIMTIHKAKGLEFDTVIIPYLELKNRSDDDQLLLWLDRPRAHNDNDLILAPIKAKHHKYDPIYVWLREIEKTKAQHELTRLLYVAVTRAKKNLYLTTTLQVEKNNFKKPNAGSFLELLWGAFEKNIKNLEMENLISKKEFSSSTLKTGTLKRLKISEYKKQTSVSPEISNAHTTFDLSFRDFLQDNALTETNASRGKRYIGTVTHQILEQISREGLALWTEQKIELEKPRWKKCLIETGLPQQIMSESLAKVEIIIRNLLNDSRAQWILHTHTDHKSEYALTTVLNGVPVHYVIDRTFIDINQVRWIIDYKTGAPHDNQNIDDFLAQAQTMHHEQLEKYAAIMHRHEKRAIRLGIYFPAFGGWCEWAWQTTNAHG